ncbi:DUF1190 domain-containing protein [Endozoicomonadaceae bacterium StTr2]
MKRSKSLRLSLLGVTPFVLAGCGAPSQDALIYPDTSDCARDGQLSSVLCTSEYKQAYRTHLRTVPRYKYRMHCADDFGSTCERQTTGDYIPTMQGYMLATREQRDQGMSFAPVPLYLSDDGDYVTGDYQDIDRRSRSGKIRVPKHKTVKPTIKTTTMTRGGFGSRAASFGSWGG